MTPPQPSLPVEKTLKEQEKHVALSVSAEKTPKEQEKRVALSVPVEKTPKEQEKCVTLSVPESSHRNTRSGQVVKAKSKSQNIKAPNKYSLGSPLIPHTVLHEAGIACQALHFGYMRKTKE